VLARQTLYPLKQMPGLLGLVVFEIGSHLMPGASLDQILLSVLACVAKMTSMATVPGHWLRWVS
jgi:hypothetical protein